MQTNWLCAILSSLIALAPPAFTGEQGNQKSCSIEDLGTFSARRFTEEHAYAYQFDLWQCGREVLGLYLFTAGLQGDSYFPISSIVSGKLDKANQIELAENTNTRFAGTISKTRLMGKVDGEIGMTFKKETIFPDSRNGIPQKFSSDSEWKEWADKKLKEFHDNDSSWIGEQKKCLSGGDGCVNYGNHLKMRGRTLEALSFWKKGCDNGDATGCRFAGDKTRYIELLKKYCSSAEVPKWKKESSCRELKAVQ